MLSIVADAIEGGFTAAAVFKLASLILRATGAKLLPKYSLKSMRFHHSFGAKQGRFVKTAVGRFLMGLSSGTSMGVGITAELLEDEIDE